MPDKGIEAVYVETHNWGRTARFFQHLGFTLDFETGHSSGQLSGGDGPYVFIAEVPSDQPPRTQVVLRVPKGGAVDLGSGAEVVSPWADTHYGTREMTVRDPDGQEWILQAAKDDAPEHGTAAASVEPDNTAVRTALWRALHLEADAEPHVLVDAIGLRLAGPGDDWRQRPDMDPAFTAGLRASMVARTRYVEDLVGAATDAGPVRQYVLLGAGLDTFAQRHGDLAGRVEVFEVDQPGTQEWKRGRLIELGYGIPDWLHLVPSDFRGGSWREGLVDAGFDPAAPAVVASTGVSMYLTAEANAALLRDAAALLAPGSTLAMTFLLPAGLLPEADRERLAISQRGAAAAGTPFLSFFTPDEMLALARSAGFGAVRHVSCEDYNARYFTGRADGLRVRPGEDMLIATR
jgi:methyltransferase (TIGR00027 family)